MLYIFDRKRIRLDVVHSSRPRYFGTQTAHAPTHSPLLVAERCVDARSDDMGITFGVGGVALHPAGAYAEALGANAKLRRALPHHPFQGG
jgi:hypothetical protein